MVDLEQENRHNSSDFESTQEQLDRVLDRLDDQPKAKQAEKQVFVQSPKEMKKALEPTGKSKTKFKDLGWYWKLIKWPVLILVGLKILTYILAAVDSLELLMMDVIEPLLLLVDFAVLGVLAWRVKKKKGESSGQVFVTTFLAGFGIGLIMSIFKTIWFREFWTIFNLITEPVFMGLVGGVVGLAVSLFVKSKRT